MHVAQLRACKVYSLLCRVNEEKSCLDLLHLPKRAESSSHSCLVCGFTWDSKGCTWIFARVFASLQPSLWFRNNQQTILPERWSPVSGRRQHAAVKWYPHLFSSIRGKNWNFTSLTYSMDFQHFATMTEITISWELVHALWKLFFFFFFL